MIYKTNYLTEQKLLSLPETGMGYQFISAKTTDIKKETLFVVYNAEIPLDFPNEFSKYQNYLASENYQTILNKIEFLNIEPNSISLIQQIDIYNYFSTSPENLTSGKGRKSGEKRATDNPEKPANGKDEFVRLSAYENDKRIDLINNRLLPGSYATTCADNLFCVMFKDDPVDRYSIPNGLQIQYTFFIRPTQNDILQKGIFQPAFGQTGGGEEVYFETGTSHNTCLCKKPYGVTSSRRNIKLKKEHIQYLAPLPESGLGYQIVDILLTNGQLLKNRTVVNSELLILEDFEDLDSSLIEKIKLNPKV